MSNSNNKYSIAVKSRDNSAEDGNTPYQARLVIHEISSDEENDGSDSSVSSPQNQDKGIAADCGQYTSELVSPTNRSSGSSHNKAIFENYCFVEDLKEITPPPAGRKCYRYKYEKQPDSLSQASKSRKSITDSQSSIRSSPNSSRHHHRRNSCAFKFENPISIADR